MNEANERFDMDDEIDARVRTLLRSLDPANGDPDYWHRLRLWVQNAAAPELARRRRGGSATVSEVVLSWWQTLVPTAAVAAALAAFLLFREASRPVAVDSFRDVDEMVMEGVDGPVMPTFETAADDGGIVMVNEAAR